MLELDAAWGTIPGMTMDGPGLAAGAATLVDAGSGLAGMTSWGLPIPKAPLLGFLRARELDRPAERRREARFPAVFARAVLSWHDERDGGGGGEIPVRLLDISLGGLKISAGGPLPPVRSFLIALEGRGPRRWVEVERIGTASAPGDPHQARLAFREPCPSCFFNPVAFG